MNGHGTNTPYEPCSVTGCNYGASRRCVCGKGLCHNHVDNVVGLIQQDCKCNDLKLFRVERREVHIQGYVVAARDLYAAEQIVQDGGGDIDENHFEYSHTLDEATAYPLHESDQPDWNYLLKEPKVKFVTPGDRYLNKEDIPSE